MAALLSLALAGCASYHCPTLQEYSADDARRLGRELAAMPEDSVAARYIVDARNLRRECGHR